MHENVINKFLISTLLLILLSPGFVQAQTDDEMVTAIMGIRAEIEALYSQIDQNKENYKAQMKSLALQTADTEAQINRGKTSIKLSEVELQKIKEQIDNTATGSVELLPLLNDGFELQRKTVASGIPFKHEERIASVDKIEKDLKTGRITPERALAQLWASFDDNLRLTKEIGLFKQNISLGGENILAEVAKVGTVMLFFSTPDQRVGYVTKKNSSYTYKIVTDEIDRNQIVLLFDSFTKQIRTGAFTLPNALVLQGVES